MAELLKDMFFKESFVRDLATKIKDEYKDFDIDRFLKNTLNSEFKSLALKQKMRHISRNLRENLHSDYEKALDVLLKVEKSFDGFNHLVFSDFIEAFGVDYLEKSLKAMETFTRSSSEFAIRPFAQKYQDSVFEKMYEWSKHKSEHVRRLASEGSRPKLPWGLRLQALVKDPTPIIPILENLKDDTSEYVRRSVANNLNDISKDHPELALSIAERWIGVSENTDKLIKHALRGLLKKGNKRALKLFGVESDISGSVRNLKIVPNKIKIGDNAKFSFDMDLKGKSEQQIRLEYAIHFVKSSGKVSKKVFKISEGKFAPGSYHIERKQRFMDFTTRKHYPGEHQLDIIANGNVVGSVEFELV